jgi:predicted metalloprotease with PDZ domain
MLKAEEGAIIKPGEVESERVVVPSPRGIVALRYVLSYDPKVMDNYPYAPNTSADYFHIAGCQWLLHVGDDKQERPISVEIVEAPKHWRLYSSIARNAARFETTDSYKHLASSAIGGGGQSHTFYVHRKPISVFAHGKLDIPDQEIYTAVERIVRLERRWFADYEQPFYHVIVAPRGGVIAGYAPRNAFINFVRKGITSHELNLLLAHEMFHYWLPGKMKIAQDEKYSEVRYEWLYEGFTDYFAPRILLEAGLMTPHQFAEQINKAVLNIADNPHRTETYDDFVAAAKAGKFDATYKKLSYHRGALIALNWDTQLRRASGRRDLSDFIRELYHLALKHEGKIPEQVFFDFAANYGIDAKGDLERHIVRGEAIKVASDARIKGFELRETAWPLFDPGLALAHTRETKTISGVVEGGAAYRAGLRNGMEFVRAVNANRFSNSWRADKPLMVVVKANGQERTFEFFPHGKRERLLLFHPR